MAASLEKIITAIKKLKSQNINEAQTKDWLIRPFFESLGWDFSNPDEVVPEDDDNAGKRTDYCFYVNSIPKLLVEAKSLSNLLTDNKMIIEKLNYCANRNIPLLIITNGDSYKIYYSELKGIGKDKLLQEFTLSDSADDEVIEKLSKKSFERDLLLNYSRNISLFTTIKKAIENLFQSADKKFIRIVNESVKEILGHKFGEDDIESALKQFTLHINTDLHETVYTNGTTVENNDDEKNWTVENQFKDGKWNESFEQYKKLRKQLKNIEISFTENPTKRYISLLIDSKSFCQVCGLKSGLKIWINLEMSELSEEESLKVRDVSKIGHWGMGNIECFVENGSELEWIVSLINKSYKKVM
ncbi:MAG: DUF5655 domain-containing protein [Melioribacteraceae bacterium]|nr:DUF5655 domain-containing protein [Saprospiraceae bacterium]MCF8356045.1 DUF5655 domain-containing protein [Melioribacteraceae bacterium]MCF8395520.1 DUF5655 domain-containing protein [Melioribacteraceae bacterium]